MKMTELITEFNSILNTKNTKIFTSSKGYKCYDLYINDEDLLYLLKLVDNIDYVLKTIICNNNREIKLFEYDNPLDYYNNNKFDKICKHVWSINWGYNYKYNIKFEIDYKINSSYFSTIYHWINEGLESSDKYETFIVYSTYEEIYKTFKLYV